MHVVIFRAQVNDLDAEYTVMAARMRELAIEQFGCLDFVSACEGEHEITLSYWPDEESIRNWRAHAEHVLAQEMGRKKWYRAYVVQVAEISREYAFNKQGG